VKKKKKDILKIAGIVTLMVIPGGIPLGLLLLYKKYKKDKK